MPVTAQHFRQLAALGGVVGAAMFSSSALHAQQTPSKPIDTGGPDQVIQDIAQPWQVWPAQSPTEKAMFGAAPAMPGGASETLNNGFRRVHHRENRSLTPQEIQSMISAGKGNQIKNGQIAVDTFTDYLPADWSLGMARAAEGRGAAVDSFGEPIVNSAEALPGWSQRDVDALRGAIAETLLHLDNLDLALAGRGNEIARLPGRMRLADYQRSAADLQSDRFESQHVLGNFIAQTFVRHIDASDLLPLNDARMSDDVVDSIAKYLHFYEGAKAAESNRTREAWTRGSYANDVVNLLAAHGRSMTDVLALNAEEVSGVSSGDEGGVAGAGACFNRSTFAVGMTVLSGATALWTSAAPVDDASADISLPFYVYFLPCSDSDGNTAVRVSTNGYLSFFQQGGNAENGTSFSNQPLPTVGGVDGFAAPWWDDLSVVNQGSPDMVSYKVEGGVGSRVFTVEYFSVSHLGGGTGEFFYFQAKLFENYPYVQFHYDTLYSPDTAVDSRTVGLEDFTGTSADCGPSCSSTITGAPTVNEQFTYPAEPNDGCLSARCLEEGRIIQGTNMGAGGTDLSTCSSGDPSDVWYSFTAPIAATITVSTCYPGTLDTVLSVFDACNGTQLACNDDFCGLKSQVNFQSVAGVTYRIRLSGFANARGTFGVLVDYGIQGDTCIDPWVITIPGTGVNFYSTFDNTGCEDESTCASSDTIDEWLLWISPTAGVARASTCTGSTDFDTTLAVYAYNCNTLSPIACNDDATPYCNGELTSRVLWVADANTPYLLRVAGFAGARGEYDIALSYSTCPADVSPRDAGDGQVNVADLLAVITNWGGCSNCREDFMPAGGDNSVNVADLLGVVTAWGTCP